MVGGDTEQPDQLESRVTSILLEAKAGKHLSEEALERTRKKKIGGFLRAVNSPEYIANQFTRYAFNEMNLFEVVSVLEELTFDDIKHIAQHMIDEKRITTFHVVPKG